MCFKPEYTILGVSCYTHSSIPNTQIHMHTLTYTVVHTLAHVHPHSPTHIHSCEQTTHTVTHTLTNTPLHAHTHSNTHTTHTHSLKRSNTHTHTGKLCIEDYIALQEMIVPIVVGGLLAILLVLIFVAYIIAYIRRKRKEGQYERLGENNNYN